MEYLEFNERDDHHIGIWNKEKIYLGALEKIRVGAWMSWCLTDVADADVYFSAGCLDEIRSKIRELNGKKKWQTQ